MDVVPYIAPAAATVLNTLVRTVANNPEASRKIASAASNAAASRIKTAYRNYKTKGRNGRQGKRRKRTALDSVPNTKTVSHQEVNTTVSGGFQELGRKVLFATPLRLIEAPNFNYLYGKAPANVFHLNGFKFCGTFKCQIADPINVHIKFVQPVRENITVSDIPTDMFH